MSAGQPRFRSAREWIETGRLAPYHLACRTAGAQGVFMTEAWQPAGDMSYPALDDLLLLIDKQGAGINADFGAGSFRVRNAPDALYLLVPGTPGSILVDAPHVIRTLVLPREVVRRTLAEAGRDAIDFGHLHGGPFHDSFLLSIAERLWEAGGETGREHQLFADTAAATLVARLLQLAAHAPPGLAPPRQTGLIAEDLARLAITPPPPAPLFTLGRAGPGHALGTAWVLAGSALGNRAIAKQVRRIGGGAWPAAFLDDEAMMAFWQALRAQIERPAAPAEAAGATRAAEAVFAHFLAVADAPEGAPA